MDKNGIRKLIREELNMMQQMNRMGRKWIRKPNSWEEVSNRARFPEYSVSMYKLITEFNLDQIMSEDLYDGVHNEDEMSGPLEEFYQSVPQYFILTFSETNNSYLINTEGYNYARYIMPIINDFDDESENNE